LLGSSRVEARLVNDTFPRAFVVFQINTLIAMGAHSTPIEVAEDFAGGLIGAWTDGSHSS